ncbi:MAG: hypothetical protein R3Y45_06640 [Bacillota bacterium]
MVYNIARKRYAMHDNARHAPQLHRVQNPEESNGNKVRNTYTK